MTGESANSQKMLLAAAIAEGTAVAKWASSNEVPERTAYYWAEEPGPWARKTDTVVGGKTRTFTAAKCRYVQSGSMPSFTGTASFVKIRGVRIFVPIWWLERAGHWPTPST